MNNEIYLSVIIPAYNEEKRLPKTLADIGGYLRRQNYSWEIIVIDGGSADRTIDMVRSFAVTVSNLKLIEVKNCQGKGQAVREGMLAAQGKFRLFTDADNSTSIDHIEKMRPYFDRNYEVVICSRDEKDAPGAKQNIKQQWWKRLLGNLGNLYIQWMAVRGIWDTQCGFKAFRDYAAEKIFASAKIDRWAFDVEALAIARKLDYKIAIIPADWKNDPATHVSFGAYFKTLWEVHKINRYIKRINI